MDIPFSAGLNCDLLPFEGALQEDPNIIFLLDGLFEVKGRSLQR